METTVKYEWAPQNLAAFTLFGLAGGAVMFGLPGGAVMFGLPGAVFNGSVG